MKSSVILIAGLTASACNQLGGANPRICGSIAPRITGPSTTAIEQRQVMISCIDHWSRRLAKSKQDTAVEVAEGAIGACQDAIEMYVSMEAKENHPTEGSEAVSAHWRRHALFVAVQTRAGNCELPPEG